MDVDFGELGIDSIILTETISKINRYHLKNIHLSDMLQIKTIRQLQDHIQSAPLRTVPQSRKQNDCNLLSHDGVETSILELNGHEIEVLLTQPKEELLVLLPPMDCMCTVWSAIREF